MVWWPILREMRFKVLFFFSKDPLEASSPKGFHAVFFQNS